MGGALLVLAPLADPYLTRGLAVRATALLLFVSGGVLVYAAACFATGAFAPEDLRLLLRRRAR